MSDTAVKAAPSSKLQAPSSERGAWSLELGAEAQRQGILFVLSAPSGAGKDAILAQFLREETGVQKCVTATTRARRAGEVDGQDYHFWSTEEFERRRSAGELLESAVVHGNLYGTPRRWVEERLEQGIDVILKIDVQGGLAVKAQFPDAVMIFVMPPSLEVMEERLRGRGSEDEAQIRRRLQDATLELAQRRQYDYIIINDRLQTAVAQLVAIVIAERCRASRVAPEGWEPLAPAPSGGQCESG